MTAIMCKILEMHDQLDAANLRLEMAREAARWLAQNPPGTPVPDWIDAVVSPLGISDDDLEDYRTAKTRGRGGELPAL